MPGILGMVLPIMNVGKTENKGYEFQLKWNDKIGDDFRYWANFNLSLRATKLFIRMRLKRMKIGCMKLAVQLVLV